MKRPSLHRQRGIAFTLVELLVVIAIIAILAAVVTVAASGAIKAAKRTKAASTAAQIQTAVQSYYTEYNVYPVPTGTVRDAYYTGTDAADWKNLTEALCGNINPLNGQTIAAGSDPISNTHNVAYLSPTRSDLNTTTGILANPFGGTISPYFYIAIDSDYSGVVGDSGAALNVLPDFTANTTNYMGATLPTGTLGGVAVWCPCDQPLIGTASTPSVPNFWKHTY
jgi:prepilin-type N-terminal cleavage/methylation domain-containing protein